jgi:hypothetical protein
MYGLCNGAEMSFPLAKSPQMPRITRDSALLSEFQINNDAENRREYRRVHGGPPGWTGAQAPICRRPDAKKSSPAWVGLMCPGSGISK